MENILNSEKFPSCAIGTWGWGKGINGGKMIFGLSVSEDILAKAYKSAVTNGFILFDTAAVYGNGSSEKILGEFIDNDSRILISTKYTPQKNESADSMKNSLYSSLKRLNRDYVDIFWLHSPVNIKRNIEKMIMLLKSGKIKNIGVSNFNLNEIKLAEDILKKSGLHLFGVQNHYSVLYRQSEQSGILKWCEENKTLFFAYMLLEQGVLAGAKSFPLFSRRGMAFPKSRLKKLEPLINTMKKISERYNANPANIAVAYAVYKGMIPIIGVTKPYQAEELSKSMKIMLEDDDIDVLEKAAKATGISVKAGWEKKLI